MDSLVKDFLTLYGPLGLGWLFACALYLENRKLTRQVFDLTTRSNRALEMHGRVLRQILKLVTASKKRRGA